MLEVTKLQANLNNVVNTLTLDLLFCIGLSENQVFCSAAKLAKLEAQVPAIGKKLINMQNKVELESQVTREMFENLSLSDK